MSRPFVFGEPTTSTKYLSNPPINSKRLTDLVKSSIPEHVELIGSLPDPARRVLLEVCFQDQAEEGVKISKEELKNKALLVSMMFGSEAFLASKKLDHKPEEFLEWSFDYDEVRDYEDLKFSLDRVRFLGIAYENEGEAKAVDGVLQRMLQSKLEEEFACLKFPFGALDLEKLKQVLDVNFDLREFSFSKGIDSEVKKYIEDVIERNKACDKIYCASEYFKISDEDRKLYKFINKMDYLSNAGVMGVFSATDNYERDVAEREIKIRDFEKSKKAAGLRLLVETCKENPGFMAKYLKYLENRIDKEEFVENLKELVASDILALKVLNKEDCIILLESCYGGEEDYKYKAAFISGIVAHEEIFANEDVSEILAEILEGAFYRNEEDAFSYSDLQKELEAERKNALADEDVDLANLLEQALQYGLQGALQYNHECLRQKVGFVFGQQTLGLEKLSNDLEENYCLRSFEFTGLNLDPKIESYIKIICSRNKIFDILDYDLDMDSSEEFINIIKNLDRNECKAVFNYIDTKNILNLIKKDAGEYEAKGVARKAIDFVVGISYSKPTINFNCLRLKQLWRENPDGLNELLISAFKGSEGEDDVARKAQLVAGLLGTLDSFTGKEKINNPAYNEITEALYWSIVTYPGNEGRFLYNCKSLEEELARIKTTYIRSNSKVAGLAENVLNGKTLVSGLSADDFVLEQEQGKIYSGKDK